MEFVSKLRTRHIANVKMILMATIVRIVSYIFCSVIKLRHSPKIKCVKIEYKFKNSSNTKETIYFKLFQAKIGR